MGLKFALFPLFDNLQRTFCLNDSEDLIVVKGSSVSNQDFKKTKVREHSLKKSLDKNRFIFYFFFLFSSSFDVT